MKLIYKDVYIWLLVILNASQMTLWWGYISKYEMKKQEFVLLRLNEVLSLFKSITKHAIKHQQAIEPNSFPLDTAKNLVWWTYWTKHI